MKIKSLITFSLLFVIGFSVVHEFIFTLHDNDHRVAVEYVSELNSPKHHGDLCDIHFEYHKAFLLAEHIPFKNPQYSFIKIQIDKESYDFKIHSYFLKPPIV